jgi:TonB family protein
VQSAVQHSKGAQHCYEELLRRDRDARGKMLVDLRVEEDGSICHAGVLESSFEDELFHTCILDHVRAWTIPGRPDGPLQIHIPFSFKPKQKTE